MEGEEINKYGVGKEVTHLEDIHVHGDNTKMNLSYIYIYMYIVGKHGLDLS
jgi:hypothetical protein